MTDLTEPGTGRIEGLDGLRAFAVIAVLVFHLRPSAAPGGFLGVDVFFVISGFLITTLLLRERNRTGHIDLLGFWTRRARRLIPALVLVVSTSIAAATVVNGDLLVNIRRHVFGALTFSTNWVEIGAGTNYFDDSDRSLFVTFWSLAVEEQFYLFWPLAFVGLVTLTSSATRRVQLTVAVAVVSALLMAVLFEPTSVTRVYYGTDTHAFGLMIGVALAFAFSGPNRLLSSGRWQRLRLWVGFVALVGVVALAVVVADDAASTYRGGILLASLLSAVMVAALPGQPTVFTRMCRLPPLEWVGQRSYGIYLWHWPVLVILTAALPAAAPGAGLGATTVLAVVGLTLALSEASFRWVEAPIRRDGFRATWTSVRQAFVGEASDERSGAPWPRVVTAGAAGIMVVAAAGFVQAPEKSQAQQSVELGEQAIDAQREQAQLVDQQGAAAWPPELAVPPGDHIVGLGDSVLSGAAPSMYERFPGIWLDASPIRQWRDAPAIVRTMIDDGTMRDVVILNFGTNAGLKEDHSEQALRDTLAALGPDRRVVLVTVVGSSYWVPTTNETLGSISAEHANTIVADWRATIGSRPELLHRDGVHPTREGTKVYAELLATALDDLGPA